MKNIMFGLKVDFPVNTISVKTLLLGLGYADIDPPAVLHSTPVVDDGLSCNV